MIKKILALFLAASLWPAAAGAADLRQYFDAALAEDPLLGSAGYIRYAVRDEGDAACGRLWPQVSASAAYMNYDQDKAGTVIDQGTAGTPGAIEGQQGTLGVRVSQTLFDMAKFTACRTKRLESGRETVTYERALEDLIVRTVSVYLNVLAAEKDAKAAGVRLEAGKAALRQAERSYAANALSQKKLDAAREAAAAAETQKSMADNALEAAWLSLAGIAPAALHYNGLSHLRADMSTTLPDPATPDYWADKAATQNLAVLESEKVVAIAKSGVKEAYARMMPSVDAFARQTLYDNKLNRDTAPLASDNGSFSTEVVGVSMSVPLFTGGTNRANASAATNRRKAQELSHEAVRRAARFEAQKTFMDVKALLLGIEEAQAARNAAYTRYEAASRGVKAKTETTADMLEAKAGMLESEARLERARHAYILGMVSFWRAIGALSAESIAEINGWLEQEIPASAE